MPCERRGEVGQWMLDWGKLLNTFRLRRLRIPTSVTLDHQCDELFFTWILPSESIGHFTDFWFK